MIVWLFPSINVYSIMLNHLYTPEEISNASVQHFFKVSFAFRIVLPQTVPSE